MYLSVYLSCDVTIMRYLDRLRANSNAGQPTEPTGSSP